jgi:hypothetical protein
LGKEVWTITNVERKRRRTERRQGRRIKAIVERVEKERIRGIE